MGGASQVRQFKKTERYSMFHLSFVNYMKWTLRYILLCVAFIRAGDTAKKNGLAKM
jgi:hypothetical protein